MIVGDDAIRGLISLAGAFGAAFAGVYLAFSKYKKEKRWDARHRAYQEIFEAIADINTWVEETYASTKLLPALKDSKLSELGTQFHKSRHTLWRHAKIGELILSSSSATAINQFVTDLEGERIRLDDEPFDDNNRYNVLAEHCEKLREILAKHVPEIMHHAQGDLK